METGGLVFYLTWKLDELPSYGKNVVAVVMGDEWCHVPDYAHKVLATFKCYGVRPSLGCNPLLRPSLLNLTLSVKYLRTYAHYAPGSLKHTLQKLKHSLNGSERLPPIYDFPLGYGNQFDLPVKNIAARKYDLFFAGSVQHTVYPVWSPKHWIQNPKSLSRNKMLANLAALKEKHPVLRVELATMSTFAWNALHYGTDQSGEILDAATYSERMMETKICLVPRGTSPETFRYFEALRYGCVLITEQLPSRWFYDGSPAIEVKDWNELESIVEQVLGDEDLMRRKHEEAIHWWKTTCSEDAVGAFMAEKLNAARFS